MTEPFILFDLDNTLYPADSGLMLEMDRRMTRFVADYLSLDFESAEAKRRERGSRYGTTLEWLRGLHGLEDPEPYLRAVHPADMKGLISPDPGLREFLTDLPNRFALFTNSPSEHARRTLEALGVSDLFPDIWDLRRMGFRGKPSRRAYELILGDLGLRPSEALFVDDNRDNLDAFEKMGGNVFDPGLRGPSSWIEGLLDRMAALNG